MSVKKLLALVALLISGPALADLKIAIVEQTALAGTGDQDFTDSTTFAGETPKGAICSSTDSSTTDTAANTVRYSIGAMDGTREGAISGRIGFSTPNTLGSHATRNDRAYVHVDSSGNVDGYADGSLITNGIRLTWGDQSNGEKIRCVIFGGDIEFGVEPFTMGSGTSAQAVTHRLTGAPSAIIAFGTGEPANTDTQTNQKLGIGFYTSGSQQSMGWWTQSGVATGATANRMSSTNGYVEQASSGNFTHTTTISNVGATTFDITNSVSSTDMVVFVSIRATSGSMYVKSGTYTTKTTTGTQANITGMSGAPQAVFTTGSQLTSLDSGSTGAASEGWSFGMAVKNSGTGSTQYNTISNLLDDAATISGTTQWQSFSTTKSTYLLTTSGTTDYAESVSSWDSGGVTNNTDTANGAAYRVAYLALGASVSVSAPTWSVAPTVSAQDDNDYTLSATPTAACTWYAVACVKDSTAPSEAQVEAGNCTGDAAAVAAANKSITGADTLTLGGSLVRPVHDIYTFCKNVAGDTNITTLADECLDPATGKTIVNCPNGLTSINAESPIVTFNASVTPDIATGDIPVCDSATTPGACTITHTVAGLYSYDGSCASSQRFDCTFYDTSVGAMHADTMRTYVNNQAPQPTAGTYQAELTKDVAMASVDFCADLFTDIEGDALTCTSSDTGTGTGDDKRPAGTSITSGVWSGTPTAAYESTGLFTITATDVAGNTAQLPVFWRIPTPLTIPNCVGLTTSACEALAEDLTISMYPQCSVTAPTPVDTVVSQYPASGSAALPGDSLSLAVYLGVCPTFVGPPISNLKFARGVAMPQLDYASRFMLGDGSFSGCSLMQLGAATDVTTASGAGTNATSITLASAAAVYPGAWLRIGAATYRRVLAVDWATSAVTLAAATTWSNGATVSVVTVTAASIPGIGFAASSCRLSGTPSVGASNSRLVIRVMNSIGLTTDSP